MTEEMRKAMNAVFKELGEMPREEFIKEMERHTEGTFGPSVFASSPSSDGLCAQDLKAWLRATRTGNDTETDPFILYMQGRMTKGALLDVIVKDVDAYLKKRA